MEYESLSGQIVRLKITNTKLTGRIAELEARLKEAEAAKVNAVTAAHALGLARDEHWLRAEKAEADAGRLRGVIEQVEWLWIGQQNENHPTSLICPWCKQEKEHPWCEDILTRGHKPDCARQAALSPTEQAKEGPVGGRFGEVYDYDDCAAEQSDDEKGVEE